MSPSVMFPYQPLGRHDLPTVAPADGITEISGGHSSNLTLTSTWEDFLPAGTKGKKKKKKKKKKGGGGAQPNRASGLCVLITLGTVGFVALAVLFGCPRRSGVMY